MPLTKERLEQLVAHSTDIVVATDRKGIVTYYNDGAKKSLGYSAAEVLGSFVGKLYPSLEEAKRVMAAMRSPEHGGPASVETFRTTFLSKSGEEIPVAISGAILRDEHGGEDGTVRYEPKLIDDASGIGVQLVVTDANGDGRPDIVSANKRGTFVFLSDRTTASK